MNLINALLTSMFCLVIYCCANDRDTTKLNRESVCNGKTSLSDNKLLITEKGVLGLCIGDNMPEKLENYKLSKSTKIAEEGNEEPIIKLIENNIELLQISFSYDYTKDQFDNKIGQILIKNKIFKTDKNIGVGSTISEFINAYPDYNIWYSYVSGYFVIESKNKTTQFILENNGYIGEKKLRKSDMIVLGKENFSPKTKVLGIRIY